MLVGAGATDGICFQKALWGAVEREKLVAPLITRSDQHFESQCLQFIYEAGQLSVEELVELFQKVSNGTTALCQLLMG